MFKAYIKQHNVTGLKYFGITTCDDVESYKGSGVYWKNHIRKHGYDVKTYVMFEFADSEVFQNACVYFSEKYDIANCPEWANLMEESGKPGLYKPSEYTREKMRLAKLGVKKTPEQIEASAKGQIKWADIYDAKTNDLVAENVCITYWAKENGCTPNHLLLTATGKRKTHKGYYARYRDEH